MNSHISAFLFPGASNWTSGPRLPRKLQDARAINAGGKIYLTGGADDNSRPSRDEVGWSDKNTNILLNIFYVYFVLLFQIYRFDERTQAWESVRKIFHTNQHTHVLGPIHFISWIEAKYKPSTHQELCYLNFDLTKWVQEKNCQNC